MKSTEIQFRTLVDNSPEAIVVGVEGRYVYLNAAAVRLFGAESAEQLVGQSAFDRIHPGYRAIVADRLHRLHDLGESVPPIEQVYLRLDGTPVHVEVFAVPMRLGNENGSVAFIRDISARKVVEGVLRMQAERHATVLATTGDGFWIADRHARVLEANEAFARMSGYTREELLQMRIPDLEAVETPEETARHIETIISQGYDRFETRHRRKDGSVYDVEITASFWMSQQKMLVFHRDITDRKQAEAERTRNRELTHALQVSRALTEAMGNGVIGADAQRRVLFANPRAQKLLGMSEDEMRGRLLEDVLAGAKCDECAEQDTDCPCWDEIKSGKPFRTEDWTFLRGDGTRFPVSLVVAPLPPDATPAGTVLSFQDISRRKQAQQALLEADRRKNQFLAMLAHELRNPLTPIRNAAHVLGRLGLDEPKLRWAQETIELQVQHLSRLTDELLDVSRIVQGKIQLKNELLELNALLRQILDSTRPMFDDRRQSLVERLAPQPLWVNGDPVRLTQVVFNLLDNASKYTHEGGSVQIEVEAVADGIALRVRDNGPGMGADLLPHVFDLFQQGDRTLDRAQGGLGIGLTLVKMLVTMHGGKVSAHSAGIGLGSTFTVQLPAEAAPGRPAAHDAFRDGPPAESGRVLVVDDDPEVAESMAALLEVWGCETALAPSGPAALEQVECFKPHVILLDIGLAGIDGFETARRIRELPHGRQARLVAVTGYADESTRQQALAAGCDDHMGKPVDPSALLALIGASLLAQQRLQREAALTP